MAENSSAINSGTLAKLLESGFIVVTIVASAKLAAMMRISDLILSPIWLPAAVCLTAILWVGWRSLPAIVTATAFLGWVVARDAGVPPANTLMVVVGTAIGAAAQASTGRYLVHRFISRTAQVESAGDFFKLL